MDFHAGLLGQSDLVSLRFESSRLNGNGQESATIEGEVLGSYVREVYLHGDRQFLS